MPPSSSGDPVGQARVSIERMYRCVDNPDHFDVLGIDRETSPADTKARYLDLAKKWHIDRFSGLPLVPEDLERVNAIFKRIRHAFEELTDPEQRANHLAFLDRSRAGLSTNVDAILKAESLVDDGLADLARKRWDDAQAKLAEASELNPDDALIKAHLAWAQYRASGGSPAGASAARAALKKAFESQENLPEAYRYLGTIAFEKGDLARAIPWLNRCLEWAPKDVDAARLLRLARSRKDKQDPSGVAGFFSKLLKKK